MLGGPQPPAGLTAFQGWSPACLVGFGALDPGNWAVSFESGAVFGYELLWVTLFGCGVSVLLTQLAKKLGVASGKNFAQVSTTVSGAVTGHSLG